jgi:hypothetical protein
MNTVKFQMPMGNPNLKVPSSRKPKKNLIRSNQPAEAVSAPDAPKNPTVTEVPQRPTVTNPKQFKQPLAIGPGKPAPAAIGPGKPAPAAVTTTVKPMKALGAPMKALPPGAAPKPPKGTGPKGGGSPKGGGRSGKRTGRV